VILLALIFGALPFAAAADNLSCGVASAAAPVWMARPGGGGGGGVTQQTTTCVASCIGGSSVSTICQGNCTAVDTSCPYAGYVTCNGVVTSTCTPCYDDCEQKNGTSCSIGTKYCSTPGPENSTHECMCWSNHWICPY
jgi:hypothetical protein